MIMIPPSDDIRVEDKYYKSLKSLIKEEFPRNKDCVYVDHAASAQYSDYQIKAAFENLSKNHYGNPHSRNTPSELSTHAVDAIRNRILDFFNTDSRKYNLVFTSGATAAIKLVGECFKWSNNSCNQNGMRNINGTFLYTQENHTSVLGVREYAKCFGSEVMPIAIKKLRLLMEEKIEINCNTDTNKPKSLLAYPAQCNYSGAKYPLDWINQVHDGQLNSLLKAGELPNEWYVLLDAAGLVGTSHLNLSKYSPDFVPISFYKIFGYPTGLGCLLVSKRGEEALEKTYFGGGTVAMINACSLTVHRRSEFHERFEDGSLPFLSIISLDFGFISIKKITDCMENIERHTFNVARYFFFKLKSLKHANGFSVAEIYCESDHWTMQNQGSIVNFNLLDEKGLYIGYSQVEKMSSIYNIYLRTGCMCNPGACHRYLDISSTILTEQFDAGHVCGDTIDIVENRPTGSVRVSFGYPSTYDDADKVIEMITDCFVKHNGENSLITQDLPNVKIEKQDVDISHRNGFDKKISLWNETVVLKLTDIFVYPIKSCGPMRVNRWNIGSCGMEFDRQWMVITTAGITLTLKRIPKMALIFPIIDLKQQTLVLTCNGFSPCKLPLENLDKEKDVVLCTGRVCGDRIKGTDCGEEAAHWLTNVLDCTDVRLFRMTGGRKDRLHKNSGESQSISLSNESQFLVINHSSLKCLKKEISNRNNEEDVDLEDLMFRLRPNFVVDGGNEFSEDNWKEIKLGNHTFQVNGPCTRCQIVCVSPKTAKRSKEPLLTLSAMRGSSAKFGVHSFHSQFGSSNELSIGTTGVAYI